MSMRHHWHELDELLAQIDREARFKRGPFRPGLKLLSDADAALRIDTDPRANDPETLENLVAFKPVDKPSGDS